METIPAPPFSAEEAESVVSLQSFVLGVTQENFDESLGTILESPWINDKKSVAHLARTICIAVRYRCQRMQVYVSLLMALVRHESPENLLSSIKAIMLKQIFRCLYGIKPFPSGSTSLSFLFQCYLSGIYTDGEIVDEISRFTKRNMMFVTSSCWLFCWFAPEILKVSPELFARLKASLDKASAGGFLPLAFRNFSKNFGSMRANNWQNYFLSRNQLTHQKTAQSMIRKDDSRSLAQVVLQPSSPAQMKIVPTLFSSFLYLQSSPTLLEAAAFFGSVNCIKMLSVTEVKGNLTSVANYSVASGNMEAIQLCMTLGYNFAYSLHSAAQFHHITIFKWLHASQNLSLSKKNQEGLTPFHKAAESNCIEILQYCLENGVSINVRSSAGETALQIATRNGSIEAVCFLLSKSEIDVNGDRFSPLHLAAKFGDLKVVKLLIEKTDVNERAKNGQTPLYLAAIHGHADIVRLLLSIPGIDVSSGSNVPMLHVAIANGNLQIVDLLLKHPGIDVRQFSGVSFSFLESLFHLWFASSCRCTLWEVLDR